jgi:DNA-3-methyladenine glycosylase II
MSMNIYGDELSLTEADQFLIKKDPEVIPLINSFELEVRPVELNYFRSLIRSIIFQQLNGKVANVIFDRFISLFSNNKFPGPQDVINMGNDQMRSAGISNPKIKYIKNIAEAFLNNSINTTNFKNLSNQDIMEQLILIKGVGPWTAQMFLMFTLKRSDIFPTGDLGVRKGFKTYFKLKEIPESKTMLSRAKIWKPYRTIMAMYFWKVVDSSIEW